MPPMIRTSLIDVAILMKSKVLGEQNGNTINTKPNAAKLMQNKYPAQY